MRGFSLIEMVLSFALIGIIVGVSIPIFQSFQFKSDLDVAIDDAAQRFRRAQALSQLGKGDATWGVHMEVGSIVVFQGTSFAARDANLDEVTALARGITPSGMTDIVFDKLTGLPQSTGVFTFTTSDGQERFLTINDQGTILYD